MKLTYARYSFNGLFNQKLPYIICDNLHEIKQALTIDLQCGIICHKVQEITDKESKELFT
jgi:hypothetical protein